MLLDEEVFAVILAVTVVASIIGIAIVIRPEVTEPFTALGLLNKDCKMGEYPRTTPNGSYIDLCISVVNYMGKPVYYKVIYKIGDRETLPTNTTPSPVDNLAMWSGILIHGGNATTPVKIPVYVFDPLPRRIALIFELWLYNTQIRNWEYTGRWAHLYINVTPIGVLS